MNRQNQKDPSNNLEKDYKQDNDKGNLIST